jgi:O-antigen/teichoic acid export membrane protein
MLFARTVFRNSIVAMAAQLTIKLLSFGFTIVVIRSLGATAFGQYAAVASFGSVFLFIADLGLAPYAVREVARLRDAPDGAERIKGLFGNLLGLRLLLGLLSGALVITAAMLTGRAPVIVLAIALNAVNVLIFAVQGSSEAMLQGHERVDLTSGIQVVYQVIYVSLGALALWMGAGYFGLIGATMAAFIVNAAICWQAVRRLGVIPALPRPTSWWPLLRAAFPFGVIGLTLGLSYRFDSVLLNIFWGDTATGYYNAAYNLIFSLVTLSNVLNTALYPSLARQAAIAPDSLPLVYERTLRYLLLVAAPIAVGGWILAVPLVELVLGAEYAASADLLRVLIWVLPLMFCSEFLGYVVVIAGREARVARAVVASTTVNVAANLLLIPLFGAAAAAAVTLVTEVVLVAQYGWLLRDQLAQMDWLSLLVRPLFAVIAMAALVLVARELPVLLVVALGGLLYGSLLLMLRVVGADELAFLRGLIGRRAAPASDTV